MKKNHLLVFLISLLSFAGLQPAAQTNKPPLPDNFCITHEEYRLFKLISDLRKSEGLSAIPLSSSLSYVARIHVRDLNDNRPDTSYCNLNSWSDKAFWTSCCHSRFTPDPDCILGKPAELTDYNGEGHELVYWDSEAALPDTVYQFWLTIDGAVDMFLNRQKWAMYTWNAMGVGIYNGYASVWLGDEADPASEPGICKTVEAAKIEIPVSTGEVIVVNKPTNRFYLIFGSFEDEAIALMERERFIKEGFANAKVVETDNHFRVSISDHETHEAAIAARGKYPKKYREAWILNF
jgi:hypothetical protein